MKMLIIQKWWEKLKFKKEIQKEEENIIDKMWYLRKTYVKWLKKICTRVKYVKGWENHTLFRIHNESGKDKRAAECRICE